MSTGIVRLDGVIARAQRLIGGGELPSPPDDKVTSKFQYLAFPAMWARCGMPQFVIGHRLAASFFATAMPSVDLADLVVPPFAAFVVRVPERVLPTPSSMRGDEYVGPDIRAVFVLATPKDNAISWIWMATTDGHRGFNYRSGMKTQNLLAEVEHVDANTPRGNDSPDLREETSRFGILIGRLIVSTCLYLSDPTKPRLDARGGKPSKRTIGEPPMPWTIQLNAPVRVDVREAVAAYLNQGGKSPTVQCLVRGHWKSQAHGPGMSLRKMIHVEPYWRGPEDAPVAIRQHVLASEPKKPDRSETGPLGGG